MASGDSLVVVGSRKDLPQIFVEDVSEKGTLRYRRETADSSPRSPTTTSTPSEHFARPSATYGTPGSYCPASYTDAYIPPLSQTKDHDDHHLQAPSPILGTPSHQTVHNNNYITPPSHQKVNNNYITPGDSGYHGLATPYGSGSGRTSRNGRYDPFANPDGTYIGNSSIWEAVVSPVVNLKNKLRTRPSFVDDNRSSRWYKITPQQILGCIILIVMIASFGFAVLTYYRHMEGSSQVENNAKYQAIQFGSVNRVKRLQQEGRLVKEEIVDVEGNVLGGKKAAMQYGHELREMNGEVDPVEAFLAISEDMRKLSGLLEQAEEEDDDKDDVRDRLEERKMEKKRLLEKMTKEQKESIDMDTDEDLSDAHEEKSKESAAKAEENDSEKVSDRKKRDTDGSFRSAADGGGDDDSFRFNR